MSCEKGASWVKICQEVFRAVPFEAGGEPVEVESKTPRVTLAIIAVNVLMYLLTAGQNFLMASSESWIDSLGFSPILLLVDSGQAYRLLTAMFVHADIFHIFFNMYFLYVFGKAVENTLGGTRYLVLYLLSGLLASVFHVAFSYLLGGVPALTIVAVGASGAISGVLGAYLLLYPGTRLSACFFFLVPLCFTSSAAAFLLFWFALQVVYGFTTVGAGIAFFAHAGGFIGGIALIPLVSDKSKINLIRSRVEYGASVLYGFIYSYLASFRRGFSPTIKAVFAALTLALVVGATAAYIYSSTHREIVAGTRLSANMAGETGLNVPQINGFIVFRVEGRSLEPLGLNLVPPPLRITVNRLLYSGILYNPRLAGQRVEISEPHKTVAIIYACDKRISVPVVIERLRGVYNELGLLTEASGVISSRVVYITERLGFCSYTVSSHSIRIEFAATSYKPVEVTSLIAPQAAVSVIASLAALYVVLARDEDYVIIA